VDDVSARLTVHNVSREMNDGHVTCHVILGESHVVSRKVVVRVAGKSRQFSFCCIFFISCRSSPRPAQHPCICLTTSHVTHLLGLTYAALCKCKILRVRYMSISVAPMPVLNVFTF